MREKLQFIEKENAALGSQLSALEAELADKRDQLGRAKAERDTLRLKGRKIKESGSNITSAALLDDIEVRWLHVCALVGCLLARPHYDARHQHRAVPALATPPHTTSGKCYASQIASALLPLRWRATTLQHTAHAQPSPHQPSHNSTHPIPPVLPTLSDPQSHKDRREVLLAQIEEARHQYTELADSIQRANDRLQTVTEEMAIGGGGVPQPSGRSMANMAGNRSASQYA